MPRKSKRDSSQINIESAQTAIGNDVIGGDKIVLNVNQQSANNIAIPQTKPIGPANISRRSTSGFSEYTEIIEFNLLEHHIAIFQMRTMLRNCLIHFYVDDHEVYKETFPAPPFYKRLEHKFRIEQANCVFIYRYVPFFQYFRLIINGYHVE